MRGFVAVFHTVRKKQLGFKKKENRQESVFQCETGVTCFLLSLSEGEGSAEAGQKETSTCDICQFGAECDVDAEDVW